MHHTDISHDAFQHIHRAHGNVIMCAHMHHTDYALHTYAVYAIFIGTNQLGSNNTIDTQSRSCLSSVLDMLGTST